MSELVFGVMSALQKADTVAQLCRALAPHRVVLHHDFAQQPGFRIDLPHVEFVPDPRSTDWDGFGFTQGVMHLLTHCLRDPSLRYFQLLSPTCLPIRPVSEFADRVLGEAHLRSVAADVDGIDVLASEQALMNFGYRIYGPRESLRLRALYKASTWYFGANCTEHILAGLAIRERQSGPLDLKARLGQGLIKAAAAGWMGRTAFGPAYRPTMGSSWFGTGREAAEYLLEHFANESEMAVFRKLVFPDEMLISTVLHNGPFQLGEANHLLNDFDGSRPRTFTLSQVQAMLPGSKYFARKFADDPDDLARRFVLSRIGVD